MTPQQRATPLARRVVAGLKFGAAYAVAGVLLAAIHRVAKGDAAYAELHITFSELLALEIFGGLAAGAVGGALWPYARNVVAGAIIGIVATTPVAALVALTAFARPGRTVRELAIMGTLFAIAFGGAAGAGVFKGLADHTSTPPPADDVP